MSKVRADNYVNYAGTGAPTFPNGVVVTGVATATSFSGNVTGNVTGNATGLSGSPDLNVGIVTATSFEGDGSGLTNLPVSSGVNILKVMLFA